MRKIADPRKTYCLRRKRYKKTAEPKPLAKRPVRNLLAPSNQITLFEQTLNEKRINLREALDSLAEKYKKGTKRIEKVWEFIQPEMEAKAEQLMFGDLKARYPKLDLSPKGAQHYFENPQAFVSAAGSREEAVRVVNEIQSTVGKVIKVTHKITPSKARTSKARIIALSTGDFFGSFLSRYQYFELIRI